MDVRASDVLVCQDDLPLRNSFFHFNFFYRVDRYMHLLKKLAYSILWAARTSSNLVNYNPICIHFELSLRLKSFGPKKLKSGRFEFTLLNEISKQ